MEEVKKENTKELREEFKQKKRELSPLRSQLSSANSQKEECFRQLRSIRDKVRSKTDLIQGLKKERDSLTREVRKFKKVRDEFNKSVKDQSGKKRDADRKKKELLETVDFKGDPRELKRQIDKLETKIETEVMPFDKEQKLNKTIKEMRVQLKQLESLGDAWKEINSTSAGFSEVRKKAEDAHKSVQEMAAKSQE